MLQKLWMLAMVSVVIGGCGGAGAGGNTMPINTVRRNMSGDTFLYTVTGTYSQSGVVTNASTSGTASDVYTSDTYNSAAAMQDVTTTSITLQSGPATFTDTRQFDASSWATLAQSDVGLLQSVTSGAFTFPGTLTSATSVLKTEMLANGTQVSITFNVSGTNTILALNGASYQCWVIQKHAVFSDGLDTTSTIAFSPDLGAVVKSVVHDAYANGYSDTLTSTLNSVTLG